MPDHFYSRELRCRLGSLGDQSMCRSGIQVQGDEAFLPHHAPLNFQGDEEEYPFVLDVFTLMSLGSYSANANLPSLQETSGMTADETWDSWLEMNPASARDHGPLDRQQVWVESLSRRLRTKVRFVPGLRPDVVGLPYNKGHRGVGRYARNRGVNGLELMGSASAPLTGLAVFGNTRVRVYPA